MRSKSVKPSAYPALPFHGIRFLIFLSSIVTAIILAVFIYHLHADGYKLPFAFLILLIASLLSIINVIFTSLANCACGLSTKLSIMLNTLLLLIWLLALALLSYNMAHTILTSCSATYWGNKTGISICRSYKALFSFTVTGTASMIAALWLDIIVRRRANRLGAYDPMGSMAAVGEDPADVKLADRNGSSSVVAYDAVPPPMSGAQGRPYNHTLEYGHAGEAAQYYDSAPARSRRGESRVRFGSEDAGYPAQTHQTGYDSGMYR
ncbi:hypothetical protein N7448_005140 [Penicillium atrosanguineum]|uniref:uncharacterized protein n=1 Tax=Penicillium atrosanguineum TaxID=1132637 RepID=UPI0023986619|nr:uncharacterized protein N7443_008869 [Penicillium atrosanguineum]KAJ5125825.1 hypothetical protein N7526_008002 [Penicillium atrosanguineum]KAJ5136586.1 hypothetical protein N7448_005140 [Penicillium atrosanguineum]KAJ5292916.1 hypothetical protein N7443_008869 [Penicillium atrosanguineum]